MRHDRHFVDELNRRMGEGIGRMIAVESISVGPDQPRGDLGSLDDLVASVEAHGILEPLLVRRQPNGRYELVSGQRRLHAALAVGLAEVPCIELQVSDQVALEIALIENLQRTDLTPFEEAEGFQTLIDKYDYTHDRVAQAVGRSRVTVTETLRVLDIPPPIRDECRRADITAKGVLLELAKSNSETEMRALLRAIIEHGLDRAAVRSLRQRLAGRSAEDAPESGDETERTASASRPVVLRFRHPERRFSFALSFPRESQPDTQEVIAALEDLIHQLRENGSSAEDGDSPSADG
jgi:ParB family chromosome partitioning protein